MDSVDIQNFEEQIEEIQASHALSTEGKGSEDTVDDLKRQLGENLGLMVYQCGGDNEYELDRDALNEIENAGLGTVEMKYGFPRLIIENPANPDDQIEVPIVDPTEQRYPGD